MEIVLNIAALFFGWVPVMILLTSGIHHRNASVLWKRYGAVSLIIFVLIWLYSLAAFPNLAALVGWGVLAGIALTIALDIVRLTGVKLGTMPMDMPMNFGLHLTGLMMEVQKRMMMKMKEMPMEKKPAQLSMFETAAMMKPVVMEVLMEKKAKGKVMFWGYIWHFLNGIAFGLTYTLIFGGGHWLIALGWGLTVWILMMLVMPGLMMGQIPKPTFITALIAHVAMALPLFALPNLVPAVATKSALLTFLANLAGIL